MRQIRARLAGSANAAAEPDWMDAITRSKDPFLAMAAQLGLATDGVDQEIDSLGALMAGTGYVGLVHSDLVSRQHAYRRRQLPDHRL